MVLSARLLAWFVPFCLVLFAPLAISTAGASDLIEPAKQQVLAIETEWQDGSRKQGFGFIVARDGTSLIVATADHLLRGRGPDATVSDIRVRFFDRPYEKQAASYVRTPENRIDLGIVSVEAPPGFALDAAMLDPESSDLGTGEDVWFIGRSNDWYVPARPGAVNRLVALDDEIVVDGLAVRPGTSGAPLLSERGIVGMIVRDVDSEEVRATTIVAIVEAFEQWRVPFDLVPSDVPRPAAQTASAAPAVPATEDASDDCEQCPALVPIKAGTFRIGSPESEPGRAADEGPMTQVRVEAFRLGRNEVTVGEFEAFVAATGHDSSGCEWFDGGWVNDPNRSWREPGIAQTADHPVICVSYGDAVAYADWLSQTSGQAFRLPSEAEWEYAARAGTQTAFHVGAELETSAANIGQSHGGTVPVGSFAANAWGLRDMHGNVYEWVEDCWIADHDGRPQSGVARVAGSGADCGRRVIRGGAWVSSPTKARSAFRGANGIDARNIYLGFRVASDG